MIIPPKLHKGDIVRVIAPARSLSMPFIQAVKVQAVKKFEAIGLKVTFGKHVDQMDEFSSSSIESRIEDLHEAFQDSEVKLIITVIGGFNSNQLLRYIDYDLIKKNPKILCGYSDITALANAIYAKTGMITYSGPHFFNFGDTASFDYSLEYFQKCLFQKDPFEMMPSPRWSDDLWAGSTETRNLYPNQGLLVIHAGEAEGTIIGANLCTFNLLQGTEYMPSLENTVLFLEDDYLTNPAEFDRDLQSLIHQPGFKGVRGIVLGRFQKKSEMFHDVIVKIIETKNELESLPVVVNADFGHTTPMVTFPIGGTCQISVGSGNASIKILQH